MENIRESDTLARLGGDEFGLLLTGCAMPQAIEIAEKLLNSINEYRFLWEEKTFDIGASIGLVKIDETSNNINSVLSEADVACFAAKDLGRNRIHVFEPNDEELLRRRNEMQWVSRLNKALENDEFVLYCQQIKPSHNIADFNHHFEILLRLYDKENDVLWAPNAFIPAAERFNLMPAIDRWVIQKTLEYIKNSLEYENIPIKTIAINLSGTSFSDESFLNFIREQILFYQVSPKIICFEITETAAIGNLSKARHFIRELRAIGCQFALDDFGSGLSSFTYLKNLPIDYLKIDGAFMRDLVADPIDYAMVKSINEVGHSMGIKTIAEFVEDEAILKKAKEMGIDFVQGYNISSPELIADILELETANIN